MSNPITRKILFRLSLLLLLPSVLVFAQTPAHKTSAVEEWIQAVDHPKCAADIRIAISGSEWLFIEIRTIDGKQNIFSTKIKESELSQISHSTITPVKTSKKQFNYFIKSIVDIQMPLVPKFKYSNDLTELYFASRSMMGSTLIYRGYIRDLPTLCTLIISLFPKDELPLGLQSNK